MSQYLSTTISTCGRCGRLLLARVHEKKGAVWFHKECPDHGPQDVRVHPDAARYLELGRYHRAGSRPLCFATDARGCPGSCGLCPEHEQHVCMPIVEITGRCNLACPICLVGGGASRGPAGRPTAGAGGARGLGTDHLMSVEDVRRTLDGLVASEGQIDVLNLSGGEPTLHPKFREIVDECVSRDEILRVSVSTNGLPLLDDPRLLEHLARRNVVISLQFDGASDETWRRLRGRPLLDEKLRILDRAARLDLPVSLTMTVVTGVNDGLVGDAVGLLFERDHILSVMFQPAAYAGRASRMERPTDAATVTDVVRSLDGTRGGLVSSRHFSPLPCSHPACFSLAYYLRVDGGGFVPVKELVSVDRYLDILQNRAILGTDPEGFEAVREAVYALWSGPSALAPDSRSALAAIRRLIESISCCGGFRPKVAMALVERSIKSIFVHGFMDRHTFDLARARKCCNVYAQADGRLIPACVRNCLDSRPSATPQAGAWPGR